MADPGSQPPLQTKPTLAIDLHVRERKVRRYVSEAGGHKVEPVAEIPADATDNACAICQEPWGDPKPPPAKARWPVYKDCVRAVDTPILSKRTILFEGNNWLSRKVPIQIALSASTSIQLKSDLLTVYDTPSTANEGGLVRMASCEHVFHHACLKQWLEGNQSCPLCRVVVRSIPEPALVELENLRVGTDTKRLPNGAREVMVVHKAKLRRRPSMHLKYFPSEPLEFEYFES